MTYDLRPGFICNRKTITRPGNSIVLAWVYFDAAQVVRDKPPHSKVYRNTETHFQDILSISFSTLNFEIVKWLCS